MNEYLNNVGVFCDIDADFLDEYINFHNRTIKSSTKFSPNKIRNISDNFIIKHSIYIKNYNDETG